MEFMLRKIVSFQLFIIAGKKAHEYSYHEANFGPVQSKIHIPRPLHW